MSTEEFKILDEGMKEILAFVRGERALSVHEVDTSTQDGGIVKEGKAFWDSETGKPVYVPEASRRRISPTE